MNISFSNPHIVFLDHYTTGAVRANTGYDITRYGKAAQLDFLDSKASAWRNLHLRFAALGQAATQLLADESWAFYRATTGSGSFTATSDTAAAPAAGTYAVRVNQLATYQKIATDKQTNASAALGLAGTITIDSLDVAVAAGDTLQDLLRSINVLNNATTASDEQAVGFTSSGGTIEINAREISVPAGSTLRDIRNLVNQEALLGVQAAVMDNRIYLADPVGNQTISLADTSGTVLTELGLLENGNAISTPARIDVRAALDGTRLVLFREQARDTIRLSGDTGLLQSLGFWDSNREIKNELTATQHARVTVNGTSYERASNVVDDVIPGITLTLEKNGSHAETLTIANDTSVPRQAIEEFVAQYNNAMEELNQALADEGSLENEQFGWQVRSAMQSGIKQVFETLPESFSSAQQAGLNLNQKSPNIQQDSVGVEHAWNPADDITYGTVKSSGKQIDYKLLAKIGIIYDTAEGTLTIDHTMLEGALAAESATVKQLFADKNHSLAVHFEKMTQNLVKERSGSIQEELQYVDFLKDMEVRDGKWARELSEVYSRKKLEYSMLNALQNSMFSQRENLQNAQNLYGQ
jgi:flagellar capping protein FliD